MEVSTGSCRFIECIGPAYTASRSISHRDMRAGGAFCSARCARNLELEGVQARVMPNYYGPFGPRGPQSRASGIPGSDTIQQLVQAYQALVAKAEKQVEQITSQQREIDAKRREVATQAEIISDLKREIQIKDEALRRQGDSLKQTEAELVWARAGLKQQERQEQQQSSPEEATWREKYIRLQAELENLRRRWEQRFETDTANARQEILRDMLPFADHLELALQHGAALEDEQAKEYMRNMNATYQAFVNTLKRYYVTPIEAYGEPFDPNLHEAVGQLSTGEMPSGNVAQVVQTGYMEGDRLLRPARVLIRE
jgi:molecular chaperone GrpE